MDLNNIPVILCNPANYYSGKKRTEAVKFIVLHYTGNTNDTAVNNCKYYRDNKVSASAHYYCDDKGVWCSVPPEYTAWAVGIGSRTAPYSYQSHWKIASNANTVSVEMCGGKTSAEASGQTKQNAAELTVELLKKYGLTPSAVIRHFDVTGKYCPWWSVEDPAKWLDMQMRINKLFYQEEEDTVIDNEENYQIFKRWMARIDSEKAAEQASWEADAMRWAEARQIISDGRPKSGVTRGELAKVLQNMYERGYIQ